MAKEGTSTEKLDIDAIVREVFARLAALTEPAPRSAQPAAHELRLSAKVISVGELDGRLNGARQVVVPRGAVITPAARDLLKRQKIDVSYATENAAVRKPQLLVGLAETRYEAALLLRSLGQEGIAVERLANTKVISAVDELCNGVSRGSLGLLLTDRTAAAVCLANRVPGVRAIAASDKRQVTDAVADVGVNLLVVAPAARGLFELRQMVKEFTGGPARVCPQEFSKRLGI